MCISSDKINNELFYLPKEDKIYNTPIYVNRIT